jgi:hypothetical protein
MGRASEFRQAASPNVMLYEDIQRIFICNFCKFDRIYEGQTVFWVAEP